MKPNMQSSLYMFKYIKVLLVICWKFYNFIIFLLNCVNKILQYVFGICIVQFMSSSFQYNTSYFLGFTYIFKL
jgi:hypothetical protein